MAIFWDENLRTGIEKIDEEHKKLFRLMGKLEKIKRSKNMFLEALIEVENYVREHFATEEGFMTSLEYPYYEEHKLAHERFKRDYKILASKASKVPNVIEIANQLVTFMEDWIKEHYTSEDVRLAVFLKDKF